MSRHIERTCVVAIVVALLITMLLMNGGSVGIQARALTLGYEDKLFDNTRVHTIDIVIDDWDAFLQTAQSEEYSVCDVVIDGEPVNNVGIRGKGNTSLSTVASMNSDRYSFKIEFDQYDSTQSYYGLDKLSLNNLIQDNTMMKDYLSYTMMTEFGAAAPLCSYVWITVNGEDWGLYLAVEAVEESFLRRNYGNHYGDLYKPDSISMGGGRGNGMDFDFEEFMGDDETADATTPSMPDGMEMPDMGGMTMPGMTGGMDTTGQMPGGMGGSDQMGGFGQMGGMGGFGMGSSDVKLQYAGDDPDSYSAIFDSAKTDVTEADQTRLIAALQALNEGKDSAVDAEAVMRYFVVHNYVVNGDSYTGSMVHNYYLYEEDGQLSMIPWDYNLAFGTFQGSSATSAVNDDIDAPLSTGGGDRPMFEWITGSAEYTDAYHDLFREFLDTVDAQTIISQAKELIAPYVERDPTRFCTYEEFETGVDTLAAFCDLRSESVARQLDGTEADVDATGLNLSDMGSMGLGGMEMPDMSAGQENGQIPQMPSQGEMPSMPQQGQTGEMPTMPVEGAAPQMPGQNSDFADMTQPTGEGTDPFGGMTPPQQGEDPWTGGDTAQSGQQDWSQMPGQGEMPQMPGQTGTADSTTGTEETTGGNQQFPGFGGQGGMTIPEGMTMPEGAEDMFSGNQGSFPNRGQTGTQTTQGGDQWILLAVTVVILAAGLLFAFLFKR